MTENSPDWFQWNDKWQPEPTRLAYEECQSLMTSQSEWLKAIEGKVTTVFALASVVITVAPTIQKSQPTGISLVVWGAAILFYILAVVQCARAYNVRSYKSDPDPLHMLVAEHLTLTEAQFRIVRLREIAVAYKHNRDIISDLASHLRWALRWAGTEVAFVAAALLLGA